MNTPGDSREVRLPLEPAAEHREEGEGPAEAECPETVDFDGSTGNVLSKHPSSTATGTGGTIAGFELLERIGSGGMGVVYKARQVSLNRIVALKLIRRDTEVDSEQVERFRAEAEAAGGLDHRGIVPVYEIGRHADQDYYAMGYVAGESLGARLQRGPLEPREAAGILRQVAEALAYAHERGVIHRDVKPGNILMDANGEPRLADFGLARRLDVPDQLTRTGQVLGTPSYMPPEQARGARDEIGPWSDVYALGAVLYAALTGRPPFEGANVPATLRLVHESEPVRPRRLNPAIDRDLETICLKCLEKVPAARYRTAAAVGEDVARYLDGRPIRARPLGYAQRLGKWARRHPAVAGLAAAILLLLISGLAAGTLAYREVVLQRDAANRNAEEARIAATETIDALKFVVFDVHRRLEDVPGTESVRQELLRDELPRLASLVRQYEDLPEAERTLMQIYLDLGQLHWALGQADEALSVSGRARSLGQQLMTEHPEEPGFALDYLIATLWSAQFQAAVGETDSALALFKEVRAAVAALPQESSAVLRLRFATLDNLGVFYRDRNEVEKALACFRECLQVTERLAELGDPVTDAERGSTHNALAAMLLKEKQFTDSLQHAELALDIAIAELEANPRSPAVQDRLCSTLITMGRILLVLDEKRQALDTMEQCATLNRTLVRESPLNTEYQRKLSTTLTTLGLVRGTLGDGPAARSALVESWEIINRLQAADPKNHEFRFDGVAVCEKLATFELSQLDLKSAVRWLDRGRPLLGSLAHDAHREVFEQLYARATDSVERVERCIAEPGALRAESDIGVLCLALVGLVNQADASRLLAASDHLMQLPVTQDGDRYNIACAHAKTAENLSGAGQPAPDGQTPDGLQERFIQRALQLLQELNDRGFFEQPNYVGLLESDTLWNGLRNRSDFPAARAAADETESHPSREG